MQLGELRGNLPYLDSPPGHQLPPVKWKQGHLQVKGHDLSWQTEAHFYLPLSH